MNKIILIVEDNSDDAFLLQIAFERAALNVTLRVVVDGKEALDYLKGSGGFADRGKYPLPALILLDLQLPYVTGLEVLQEIRSIPSLNKTVVIMLTSSSAQRDIDKAYEIGANSFLVKPSRLEERKSMVEGIYSYWFGLNRTTATN